MYEKTFKSAEKMTNGNNVTHNTKHTILINKTNFASYSVPQAHTPVSVFNRKNTLEHFFSDGVFCFVTPPKVAFFIYQWKYT
jgi:hypothetical protein